MTPGLPALLAGLLLAALSGAAMKGLAETLPTSLIAWVRFTGFAAVMVPLLLWRGKGGPMLRPAMPLAQVLRGLTVASSTTCFVLATRTLDFAEAITLLYVYPFLITLFAPVFLDEPPRLSTFLGVAGGFLGVLMVARPGLDGMGAAGTPFALSAGAFVAAQMIFNRRLGGSVDPMLTSFWGACVAALLLTPLAAWPEGGVDGRQGALLGAMVLTAASGQTLIAYAFARSPAADLAPFSYAEIVAAVGIGFALFGTLPDTVSIAGMAVIVVSGVAVARVQQGRITARRSPKV